MWYIKKIDIFQRIFKGVNNSTPSKKKNGLAHTNCPSNIFLIKTRIRNKLIFTDFFVVSLISFDKDY